MNYVVKLSNMIYGLNHTAWSQTRESPYCEYQSNEIHSRAPPDWFKRDSNLEPPDPATKLLTVRPTSENTEFFLIDLLILKLSFNNDFN